MTKFNLLSLCTLASVITFWIFIAKENAVGVALSLLVALIFLVLSLINYNK